METNNTCTCKVCGKPLSDPVSVELGMGPICGTRGKSLNFKNYKENLFTDKSLPDFHFEIINNIIVVYDRDSGGKTVTNGADLVAKEVCRCLAIDVDKFLSYKFIYQDTDGVFDGIEFSKTLFPNFYPIREKSLTTALKKIK